MGLQITPIENKQVEKSDKVDKRKRQSMGNKKEDRDLNLDSKHGDQNHFNETNSETTCYESAVEKLTDTIQNRFSSSSDEADISDPKSDENEELELLINRFINDQCLSLEQRRSEGKTERKTNYDDMKEPQPHCSREEHRQDDGRPNLHQRTEQLVRDAENAKAKMLNVPGKDMGIDLRNFNRSLAYSHLVDDDYRMVASHLEESLIKKIEMGEYVDFGKLLPKDKVQVEEDHRMEIVSKGGFTYWVPLSDRDKTSINTLDRWDAAFRVYQKIYTLRHPTRSAELVEYAHVIHSIAGVYTWQNVYKYDREFRIHMERYPEHNWGIILQQAWSLSLKDKISVTGSDGGPVSTQSHNGERQSSHGNNNNNGNQKRICFKYNQGKCTFGFRCKFEHKCGICGKYGHGAYNCRKIQQVSNYSTEHDRETGERRRRSNYDERNKK